MEDVRNRRPVPLTVVHAMSSLIRKRLKSSVCGFVPEFTIHMSGFSGMFGDENHGKTGVQIHFNGQNHFVTSSCSEDDRVVHIYDSLTMPLSNSLKLQLWLLYGNGTDSIKYRYVIVRDQNNEVDCAFFAAVFAFEIAVEGGRDLSKSSYDGAEFRK